jgi:hypothetical protein
VFNSFLSLASRPICPSPAREVGGRSCVSPSVYSLRGCIGQISVSISWNAQIIVTAWAAAKSSWALSYISALKGRLGFASGVLC